MRRRGSCISTSLDVETKSNWPRDFGRRSSSRRALWSGGGRDQRALRELDRLPKSLGQFDFVSTSNEVDIHDPRRLMQEMVMEGRQFQTFFLEFADHRI